MTRLTEDTTVVVATGEGAKFFSQMPGAHTASLTFERELLPGDLADEGPSGKMPPETNEKDSMEATFSKILAQDLYDKVHKGKISRLALVADPRTLGEMRPLMHKEVQDVLFLELDKTLNNAPIKDIEKVLDAALN